MPVSAGADSSKQDSPGSFRMTNVSESAERRQSHCPTCHTRVLPFQMRSGVGTVILTNRCDPCDQEWTVEYAAPDILRERRRDRAEGRVMGASDHE